MQIKSLFEVWTVSISKLNVEKRNKALKEHNFILGKYNEILNEDDDFRNSISQQTTKLKATKIRFKVIENLLNKTL